MQKITSKIIKTELVDWRALKPLQNDNLKEMTKDSYAKLRQSMINNNFIMPFTVWQNKKDIWIIDGHHRQRVLLELVKEGVSVPDKIPANFIGCANRKEAVKLILVFTSQYAHTTDEGLYELISTEGFDFADLKTEIDLPNIDNALFESAFISENISALDQAFDTKDSYEQSGFYEMAFLFPVQYKEKILSYIDKNTKQKIIDMIVKEVCNA